MQCCMSQHCWSKPDKDSLRECLWCRATGKDLQVELRCRVCGDTGTRFEIVEAKEEPPAYIETTCERCPDDGRGEYQAFAERPNG